MFYKDIRLKISTGKRPLFRTIQC